MTTSVHDPDIGAIEAVLGRPLRVLHIGNIANNAYNNARIRRQYGVDADVLCYDYYHVMATPEWEDGGLETTVDPGLPNWWATNLGGYRRPEWYVQGPLASCLDYLDARRRKQAGRLWSARIDLEQSYIDLLRFDAALHKRDFRDPRPLRKRFPALAPLFDPHRRGFFGRAKAAAVVAELMLLRGLARMRRAPQRHASVLAEARLLIVWPLLAAASATPPRIFGARAVLGAYRGARRLMRRPHRDDREILDQIAQLVPEEQRAVGWRDIVLRSVAFAPREVLALAASIASRAAARIFDRLWPQERPAPLAQRVEASERIARDLLTQAGVNQTTDALRKDLAHHLAHHTLLFASVLKHYDVIQGYSIDGFVPLVNGHAAFASYEHGTLRELPFEPSLTGLMCRLAYLGSPAIFITNTDVLPSVARLQLSAERVHYLPHAFDDRKLTSWRDARPDLQPPVDEVVFFSPTRQHWRDADRSLTKGNDVMLRAAGRVRAAGRRFRLVLVEWGRDVGATRQLIDDLRLADCVTWVATMGKQDLWRSYCTSHAVLDQFVLPALGGVGFETLALGCRLITHTDRATLEAFFGAAPPVLPAGSIDEVEASLLRVLDDPADAAGLGPAGRAWIDEHHSARRTVSIQAKAYRELLVRAAPSAPDAIREAQNNWTPQAGADTTLPTLVGEPQL